MILKLSTEVVVWAVIGVYLVTYTTLYFFQHVNLFLHVNVLQFHQCGSQYDVRKKHHTSICESQCKHDKHTIKHGTYKVKKKIACTVMATELQHKHLEKKKTEEDFVKTTSKLKSHISFINITILHQINVALKRKC